MKSLSLDIEEVFAVGAACSEVLSGPRLAKVLRPAVESQVQALEALQGDGNSPDDGYCPLSVHTSLGLPPAYGPFVEELRKHLPWREDNCATDDNSDWFVNLQLEGTSAVWAGVEGLCRLQQVHGHSERRLVAVAEKSYHGPKTTGLGQPAQAMWPMAPPKHGQISYAVPPIVTETDANAGCGAPDLAIDPFNSYLDDFDKFLSAHGQHIAVLIVEPQWGSSNGGRVWPRAVLKVVVNRAQKVGILVLSDEIMCGLGRHGQMNPSGSPALFLSSAWELGVDAVTFGKSVAAGVHPLSGVAFRNGAAELGRRKCSIMQSHTYAASSQLALLTATEVLREIPKWVQHARDMGNRVIRPLLGPLQAKGHLLVQGQGLLWGVRLVHTEPLERENAFSRLRIACESEQVVPYFVSDGTTTAILISPPMDVDENQLHEGIVRLRKCLDQCLLPCQ